MNEVVIGVGGRCVFLALRLSFDDAFAGLHLRLFVPTVFPGGIFIRVSLRFSCSFLLFLSALPGFSVSLCCFSSGSFLGYVCFPFVWCRFFLFGILTFFIRVSVDSFCSLLGSPFLFASFFFLLLFRAFFWAFPNGFCFPLLVLCCLWGFFVVFLDFLWFYGNKSWFIVWFVCFVCCIFAVLFRLCGVFRFVLSLAWFSFCFRGVWKVFSNFLPKHLEGSEKMFYLCTRFPQGSCALLPYFLWGFSLVGVWGVLRDWSFFDKIDIQHK